MVAPKNSSGDGRKDGNESGDTLGNLIEHAKLLLTGQDYKKISLDCVKRATDADKCPCASCRIVFRIETALASVAMMGAVACNGKPQMLTEIMEFIDGMRTRYPSGPADMG